MANQMNRRRFYPQHHHTKTTSPLRESENQLSTSQELFDVSEKLKQKLLSLSNDKSQMWRYRQELLDRYEKLILFDLDYAIEKKIEHDLWTLIFKNEITHKQEQIKDNNQNQMKRAETQASLQNFYEYARGYYMKLLQNVVHSYNFENSICKLTFPFIHKRNSSSNQTRTCKEASMLYFIQHILVHVGDLNRYSNQIDLAKTFYQYAIQTIPYLGQPYNQIAILHEMKNPSSLLTLGQNQLIAVYYYIRSIAIKVTFPLAISNLEKLFTRLKDIPLTRYEQQQCDFLTLFLQIIAMINLETNLSEINSFMNLFRTMIIKNFNQFYFIQMLAIIMFTMHRTLDLLLPRSAPSKQFDLQFDATLQTLITIIEQCLEAIQVPLSMMVIDEQHILPILHLSFAYLSNLQKYRTDLFEHKVFKQKESMWNSLAKLLRSFGVYASSLDASKSKNGSNELLFFKYGDYPLPEERALECFTPLNDILKSCNFKKYSEDDIGASNAYLSEKDVRQLRKLRLVSIIRNLCQKTNDKTKAKIFDHLLTYVKEEMVYFESSAPLVSQIPSSNFGVPGDRRTIQKPTTDELKSTSSNGNSTKTPRGARNIALRQFLEPAMAAAESASNNRATNVKHPSSDATSFLPPVHHPDQSTADDSEAWPRLPSLIESKDLFQPQSLEYESRPDSVWSTNDDSKDQYNLHLQTLSTPHQMLAPGLMFSHPLSKHNIKPPPK